MAHDQEVMGSNHSNVYWMDVSNARYYIQEHNKNKGSQMGYTKQNKNKVVKLLRGLSLNMC
jgi:hypothetical protein